jgi:hypothetical protein
MEIKSFSSFGIKPEIKSLQGDKIKIERILNCPIVVEDYQIKDSKFTEGSGRCLHLQIKKQGIQHVVFTGSTVLMDMISHVKKDQLPFTTTIIKENDHFQFT